MIKIERNSVKNDIEFILDGILMEVRLISLVIGDNSQCEFVATLKERSDYQQKRWDNHDKTKAIKFNAFIRLDENKYYFNGFMNLLSSDFDRVGGLGRFLYEL